MRALEPVTSGTVEAGGASVHFEVYGAGETTVYLVMPDVIVESRAWKAQIPFLARSFQVVVSDPPGNGASSTPADPAAYSERMLLDQEWAVLDAAGVERAVVAGLCTGAGHALMMAAERPERVSGVIAINPGMLLTEPLPHRIAFDFEEPRASYTGWEMQNRHFWHEDWTTWTRFFFGRMFPEPHSTKQIEDCVAWAERCGPDTLLREYDSPDGRARSIDSAAEICRSVRCPVLVINGSLDECQNPARSPIVADLTAGELVVIEGGGHLPQARDPVKVNLLMRDFIRRVDGSAARAEKPRGIADH